MLRIAFALACALAVVAPSSTFAGAPKCRAADPAAAGDADAVASVRQQIDATCPCASFPADGKKSMHGPYVTCAKGVVKAAVDGDQLRTQCKHLALYPSALSTCGYPAAPPRSPCLKTTKKGPACKVTKCTGAKDLPCPEHDDLAAADTNHDGQVTTLDSGECNPLHDCAAVLTVPQSYKDDRVILCFDGCTDAQTYQECLVGCSAGGGAFDEPTNGLRAVCEANPTLSCGDLRATFAEHCAAHTTVQHCVDQSNDPITLEKCQLVAACEPLADLAEANCLAQPD